MTSRLMMFAEGGILGYGVAIRGHAYDRYARALDRLLLHNGNTEARKRSTE
jgi:hypothetical protein